MPLFLQPLLATNRRTHLKVSLPSSIFLLAVSAGHKDASLVHGSHGKATATSYGSYLFTSCIRLCWDVSPHKLSPSLVSRGLATDSPFWTSAATAAVRILLIEKTSLTNVSSSGFGRNSSTRFFHLPKPALVSSHHVCCSVVHGQKDRFWGAAPLLIQPQRHHPREH